MSSSSPPANLPARARRAAARSHAAGASRHAAPHGAAAGLSGDTPEAVFASLRAALEATQDALGRAESAWRDDARVLEFLNATGATLSGTRDLGALLQAVIDAATPVSGAAFGAFFYRDEPIAGALPGTAGPERPRPGRPMIALSGIAPGDAFDPVRTASAFAVAWHESRTVVCDDVTAIAPGTGAMAGRLGLGGDDPPLRSFLAVPVALRSGHVAGGLFFGHPEPGVFDERTQRIVEGVAAHAAIALENCRLLDSLRRVAAERERLIDAERRARSESARAAHIKDEFLATLSHELRTPLTAILGWAKVLLLQRDDPATRRKGLDAIARNANAQARLIEELLDMSRIVSGQIRLDMQRVDLGDVIESALGPLRGDASAKGIELSVHVDAAAAAVPGDPARLRQVVANLASNAIKFTPRRGRVEIEAKRIGGLVQIAVSDTGQGIDPAFLPHVFDHFRQADGSTTRRHGGLGLGLAVVRQLATLHGGSVDAASEGTGRGARFVVRLPAIGMRGVAAARGGGETRAVPASGHEFADTDLHGLDLLVVDDETDARELIAQLLTECGASVRQACGAAEALREVIAHPPHVLLSDIGMPERDGYELIREVRRLPPGDGGEVPAIALTAFVRPEDRERALEAGYQAHLGKPVQPDELVDAVAALAPGATEAGNRHF